MSEDSLNLVYKKIIKQNLIRYGKIQIKSREAHPFGGIFSIMEQFDSTLSSVIDSTLGLRCSSFGYQYSEIVRSLMSICFCVLRIEDVTTHLMNHLSLHPTLRTCGSDTFISRQSERRRNLSYTSDTVRTTISTRLTHSIPYCSIVCFVHPRQLKEE